jgi:molybdopterin-guanine dinucleotide biosynthesis protein A
MVVAFDEVNRRDPFFNVNTPDDAGVARSLLPATASCG